MINLNTEYFVKDCGIPVGTQRDAYLPCSNIPGHPEITKEEWYKIWDDYIGELEESNRLRSIAFHAEILKDALTKEEVEEYLGDNLKVSVEEARAQMLILGLDYQGETKYPIWQFDNGNVVEGLDIILRELSGDYSSLSDLAKAGYLSNRHIGCYPFYGKTPIEVLKEGRLEDVIVYSRGVGVC